MALAENIRRLRKQQGLTQAALAQKIHVSKAAVSRFETGDKLPSSERLILLARELNTTCEALWADSEDETQGEE